ncbi:unnamed protein product [Symbiodinium natans]|uniref:Uncharacterized protein n=1 Tax=Symbiodinium natans TaxID=878477 RepID=A0A812IIX6_9DINO|nr:unnamed protein product [Symbiodinium natans]
MLRRTLRLPSGSGTAWAARRFAAPGGGEETPSSNASKWLRRKVRRTKLALSEFQESAKERSLHFSAAWRQRLRALRALRTLPASDLMDLLWSRWTQANRQFDDRFNAWFDRSVAAATSAARQVRDGSAQELWHKSQLRLRLLRWRESLVQGSGPAKEGQGQEQGAVPQASARPVDTGVLVLLGAGAGCAGHGLVGPTLALSAWAALRVGRRFVVQCLDAEDANRLFRYAPASLQCRKGELFARMHHELHVMRRIRAGDVRYMGRPGDVAWEAALDPRNDHTPASLFDLAMQSVAAHSRVREWVGETVRAVAEPDKVVYRMHEGITEVYLGWNVRGQLGEAEVQVKASGSVVDFIYIFPQGRDHYGLQPDGFVIRPNGDSWSQNTSDLPRFHKQPFGKHGGKLYLNREGIFDFDYEVGEFRSGYEGENHPRARAYRRWFNSES